jgi:hypothetical protein
MIKVPVGLWRKYGVWLERAVASQDAWGDYRKWRSSEGGTRHLHG